MAKLTLKGGTNPILISNDQLGSTRSDLELYVSGESYREESAIPLRTFDTILSVHNDYILNAQTESSTYDWRKDDQFTASVTYVGSIGLYKLNSSVLQSVPCNKSLTHIETNTGTSISSNLFGCSASNSDTITTSNGWANFVRVGGLVYKDNDLLGTVTQLLSHNQFKISNVVTTSGTLSFHLNEGILNYKSASNSYSGGIHRTVQGNGEVSSNGKLLHGEVIVIDQQTHRISNPDGYIDDNLFGDSVLISGNGSRVIIGAPSVVVQPEVHVFEKSGFSWSRISQLTVGDYDQNGKFGQHMVCSNDGSCIAISEPNSIGNALEQRGRIHVFDETSPSNWVRNDIITNPESSSDFAKHLGMTSDGNNLAICGKKTVYLYERNMSDEWDLIKKITPPPSVPKNIIGIKALSYHGSGNYIGVTYITEQVDMLLNRIKQTQHVCVFKKHGSHWVVTDTISNLKGPSYYRHSLYTGISYTDGIDVYPSVKNYGVYDGVGELKLIRGSDINLKQWFSVYQGSPSYGMFISFDGINTTSNSYVSHWCSSITSMSPKPSCSGISSFSLTNLGSNLYDSFTTFGTTLNRTLPFCSFGFSARINTPTQYMVEIDDGFGDFLHVSDNGQNLFLTSREPGFLYHYMSKKNANKLICSVNMYEGTISQYKSTNNGPEEYVNITNSSNLDAMILIPPQSNQNKNPLFFFKDVKETYSHTNELAEVETRYRHYGMEFTNSTFSQYVHLSEMNGNGLAKMPTRIYNNVTSLYDTLPQNEHYNSPIKKYINVGLTQDNKNLQIIKYIGDSLTEATERAIQHNLGQQPTAILIKRTLPTNNNTWVVWHKDLMSGNILNSGTSAPFKVGASKNINYREPTSSEFYVYGTPEMNETGVEYVAMIITEHTNKQVDTGYYTGNGTSTTLTFHGAVNMHPSLIMIKNITDNSPWVMITAPENANDTQTKTITCDGVSGYTFIPSVQCSNTNLIITNNLKQLNNSGDKYIYIMFIGNHS